MERRCGDSVRGGERVVVGGDNDDVAAVFSFADLRRLQQDDRRRPGAVEALLVVGRAFEHLDAEEVEREAVKAVREVRAEMSEERMARGERSLPYSTPTSWWRDRCDQNRRTQSGASDFELVVSSHIIAEAERALRTKRYFRSHLSDAEREGAITGIRKLARMVDPIVLPGVAPHRHDDAVLATVAAAGADWFVTGDAALLAMRSHAGVPFADPARFLLELDAAEGGSPSGWLPR